MCQAEAVTGHVTSKGQITLSETAILASPAERGSLGIKFYPAFDEQIF
jgi:hypothetical protein